MLPRFFAPDASPHVARVTLPDEEAHHATRVMRLSAGDEVALFDGRGNEWRGRIGAVSKARVLVDLVETAIAVREPRIRTTLLQGVLKGEHMDVVVRDATMIGISAIVPVLTSHTAANVRSAAGAKARDRWRRVALASAKQCRRALLPEIHAAAPLDRVMADLYSQPRQTRLVLAEPATGSPAVAPGAIRAPTSAILAVGPEGGWSAEELAALLTGSFSAVTLGPRTLRADAAALVAVSMLRAVWNDL